MAGTVETIHVALFINKKPSFTVRNPRARLVYLSIPLRPVINLLNMFVYDSTHENMKTRLIYTVKVSKTSTSS